MSACSSQRVLSLNVRVRESIWCMPAVKKCFPLCVRSPRRPGTVSFMPAELLLRCERCPPVCEQCDGDATMQGQHADTQPGLQSTAVQPHRPWADPNTCKCELDGKTPEVAVQECNAFMILACR